MNLNQFECYCFKLRSNLTAYAKKVMTSTRPIGDRMIINQKMSACPLKSNHFAPKYQYSRVLRMPCIKSNHTLLMNSSKKWITIINTCTHCVLILILQIMSFSIFSFCLTYTIHVFPGNPHKELAKQLYPLNLPLSLSLIAGSITKKSSPSSAFVNITKSTSNKEFGSNTSYMGRSND